MSTHTHRSISLTALATVLAMAVLAGLTGCLTEKQPVQVRLLNRTHQSVTARVVLQRIGSPDQTLAQRALDAGDSASMGPFAPPTSGTIKLVLERDDQFSDLPTRKALPRGSSAWDIVSPVFSTYSSIELRAANAPELPEWTSVKPIVHTPTDDSH